jgi:type IV pilus assembly protein PilE
MDQFYQDNRDYGPAPSGAACGIDPTTINNTLHYFTITCVPGAASSTAAGPQSYVATATGNEGGTMAGFSYTIDNNNNKTSTVPTNWGGTQNCWITSQGTCQ